jgi:hypothetical protein
MPLTVGELSNALGLEAGLRRLVSLDRKLELGKLNGIVLPARPLRPLRLDPSDDRGEGPVDLESGVRWPGPVQELIEVVRR